MTKTIRSAIARLLIRAAKRICVYGFTADHLDMALASEPPKWFRNREIPFQ